MDMDPFQRESLDSLIRKLNGISELDQLVDVTGKGMRRVMLRDAILVFLTRLSASKSDAQSMQCEKKCEISKDPVLLKMSETCLHFLKKTTGIEDEESESWVNDLPQLDHLSLPEVMERFSFAKDNEKPVAYERPLRLWDFIS